MKRVIKILVLLLISPAFARGADYWLSCSSGNDANPGTSPAAPVKSFGQAFTNMSGGDFLHVFKGFYSSTNTCGTIRETGTGSGVPPSGISRSSPTKIFAQEQFQVELHAGLSSLALKVGNEDDTVNFTHFDGLIALTGAAIANGSSNTLTNCGFRNYLNDDSEAFGIGTIDGNWKCDWNLIEDCFAWFKTRLGLINYRSAYNVWRRIIVRRDGCNGAGCTGGGNPNVAFTVYNSSNNSFQNIVIVDTVLGGGEPYSDFASAQHDPGGVSMGESEAMLNNEFLGCMVLNSEDNGHTNEADDTQVVGAGQFTFKWENTVIWDTDGGFNFQFGAGIASSITVRNATIGHSHQDYGLRMQGEGTYTGLIENVAITFSGLDGVNSKTLKPNYFSVHSSSGDDYRSGEQTCSVGCLSQNPVAGSPPSLRYLFRIDNGSALKGTGANGGDYGATLWVYGTTGTYHGQPGYNVQQSTTVFPGGFRNQLVAKQWMEKDSDRGFTTKETATPLDDYVCGYIAGAGCPLAGAGGGGGEPAPTPADNRTRLRFTIQ